MEKYVSSLTNEKLTRRFKNQFDLVNHTIKVAGNLISTGRAPQVEVDIKNPAVQALAEVECGRELLESVITKKIETMAFDLATIIEEDDTDKKGTQSIDDEALEDDMLRVSKPKKGRSKSSDS